MKTYLITYDLQRPELRQDYTRLIDYIKKFPFWAKPHYSVWLVKSPKDAGAIRDEIKPLLDSNDSVLVIEVKKHWATFGVDKNVTSWMKTNIE